MNALFKSGDFEVYVVAPNEEGVEELESNTQVTYIPIQNLKRGSKNIIDDLKFMFELSKIYKKIKPDVVIHYNIKPNVYGGILAHLLKVKFIAIIPGLGFSYIHKGILQKIANFLYKMSLRNAFKIIFENIDDRLLFIKNKIVTPNNSISIKGCGVNIENFKPTSKTRTSDTFVFSFVGRYLYDKGLAEFVEAAQTVRKIFPNTEFWFIGEIDKGNPASIPQSVLDKWIESKIIIEKGYQHDVRPFVANSDCIVCPSYREAIPRVIQEGMAMEKIVITTNEPGCYEAVDDNVNGFLVDSRSAEQLANAFLRVINMTEEERLVFGKAGRKKVVEIFDDRIIAAKILAVVQQAVEIYDEQKIYTQSLKEIQTKFNDNIAPFQILKDAIRN